MTFRTRGTRSLLAITGALLMLSGCNAHRLRLEHSMLRGQVIALYEEQIMDNLVRTYYRDVLVHLNYSEFAGESVSFLEAVASFGDGDNDNLLTAGDPLGRIIELDSNTWGGTLKANGTNNLKLKATPVSPPEAMLVYAAYRDFVDPGKNQFKCESERPARFHKMQKRRTRQGLAWNTTYCWIPVEARDEFLALVMDTTLAQKKPAAPKPPATETQVDSRVVTTRERDRKTESKSLRRVQQTIPARSPAEASE